MAAAETNTIDAFFWSRDEPHKSCLLYLRSFILSASPHLTEHWKYGMPFYYYRKKMFCYLWQHKKLNTPYIGFVDGDKLQHKSLIQEKRARMKILPVNPEKDIPLRTLNAIFKAALLLANEERTWPRKPNTRNRSGTQNNG